VTGTGTRIWSETCKTASRSSTGDSDNIMVTCLQLK
jgi:hypothetical protein